MNDVIKLNFIHTHINLESHSTKERKRTQTSFGVGRTRPVTVHCFKRGKRWVALDELL